MTRPARRVALYGFLGSGNIGNDASFEAVLAWLRTAAPAIAVSCITLTPRAIEARYGIPSRPLTVPPAPGGSRARSAAAKLAARLADVPRSLAAARSADAVIVPGMGVLEETLGVRPWGFPAWLLMLATACCLQRRPFVLLAVGAERARNPATRWLFAASARLASHVSYRDAVAADLAFAHPASTTAEPEPGRLVIGVISYYGRDDDKIRGQGIRQRYTRTMAGAVAQLAGQGDQVILVGGDQVDNAAAQEILAEARRLSPDLPAGQITIREIATFDELTREMARAEAVVAARFHNLIAALRLGRPTVSVGYAEKSARLMQAAGLGDYHQHIDDLDGGTLLAHLRAVRDQAPVLSKDVTTASEEFSAQVTALLDTVARDVLRRHDG
jgi:polysaccharide pyruvyl transferase WcaK-like protein